MPRAELDDLKEVLRPRPKPVALTSKDMLSTGSTLLNLACCGKTIGGFVKGKHYFLVGDSDSGKTWLSLSCLAEAARNSSFDDFRLIHNNCEDGALMDIEHYFGKALAERVEPPRRNKDRTPWYPRTIEEFYFHMSDLRKDGRPFIEVLDSMDVLGSESEQKKKAQYKKAWERRGGIDTENEEEEESSTKVKGSYGDGKAKINSSGIRELIPDLRDTGSILIVVSQTRDNIGNRYEPKTHAGGHALKFYATLQLWSSCAGQIKKHIRGQDLEVGVYCKIRVKKNRERGWKRTVTLPIYHSYGIDDIGSCIDYLLEWKHWEKHKNSIIAPEFDYTGTQERLIRKIEEEGTERDLRILVGKVWNSIEDEIALERKSRYE